MVNSVDAATLSSHSDRAAATDAGSHSGSASGTSFWTNGSRTNHKEAANNGNNVSVCAAIVITLTPLLAPE